MTLRELLKQNELRVVEVAAGADGLARTISGAVMFDNPEMVNWMRAGEIMLTTGYFLLDDPVKQEKVLRDLADRKTTMIIVTHEMNFARDVADRILFMDGGVVVEQGPARQLIEHPQEERTRRFLAHYSE